MVGNDSNRVGRTLNILPPFGEGKDYCKEFPVVDVVISFGREESTREVGAGVEISIGIALEQDGARSKQGSVSHDGEWSSDVRNRQHGSRRKSGLKSVERALLKIGPGPWLVLSRE